MGHTALGQKTDEAEDFESGHRPLSKTHVQDGPMTL